MMIDPQTHLLLHRQPKDERDRHLGHRAVIHATHDSPDVTPLKSLPVVSA